MYIDTKIYSLLLLDPLEDLNLGCICHFLFCFFFIFFCVSFPLRRYFLLSPQHELLVSLQLYLNILRQIE